MKQLNRVPFPTDVDRWFTSEINFPSVANALTCKGKLEELCGHEVTMTPADGGGVHLEGAFDLGSFNEEEDHGLAKIVSEFTNLQETMLLKFIYIDSSGYFGGQVVKYCLQTGAELECFGLNECFENEDLPVRKEDIAKQPAVESRILFISNEHPAISFFGGIENVKDYFQKELNSQNFNWENIQISLDAYRAEGHSELRLYWELLEVSSGFIPEFDSHQVYAILLTK